MKLAWRTSLIFVNISILSKASRWLFCFQLWENAVLILTSVVLAHLSRHKTRKFSRSSWKDLILAVMHWHHIKCNIYYFLLTLSVNFIEFICWLHSIFLIPQNYINRLNSIAHTLITFSVFFLRKSTWPFLYNSSYILHIMSFNYILAFYHFQVIYLPSNLVCL